MNRYPELQERYDREDRARFGREAILRPGATVEVRGFVDRKPGPVVRGRVILAKVSESHGDQVMVSTPQYGRAWFHTRGHAFAVVKEV